MKEVLSLANDFVQAVEDKNLTALYHENEFAKQHAKGCGCNQCIRHAQRSQDRFDNELWRLFGAYEDHEEGFVESKALTTLYQKYPNLGEIED